MPSSNPIIAVGISAVIAIGSATTAEAKPIPDLHNASSDAFSEVAQTIQQAEQQAEIDSVETVAPETVAPETEATEVNRARPEAAEPEFSEPYAGLLKALEENALRNAPEANVSEEEAPTAETDSPQAQSDSEAPANPEESDSLQRELVPAPRDLPPQDAPTPLDENVPTEQIDAAEIEDSSRTAPEYLDPNPNPLFFPTDPSEVEIVGTQPITLRQAIELGIRNNEDLQESRLELEQTRAALREQEAANYPQVSTGADLSFSANEQPNVVPTETGGSEVDGSNTPNSLVLGGQLQVSYDIFTSGLRSARIQAAERQVRSQELQIEVATEDLVQEVATRYYDLQEADEQVKIFQAALDEAQRSLRDAQALERAGVGTRFDVLQAEVDVANAQQDLRNQQSSQEISRRQLAQLLNISQSLELAAAEPVEVAGTWELPLEDSIVTAYRNRAELEQQLIQREIAERSRRAALAQLGPQVDLTAIYGLENTLASDTGTEAENPADDFGFLSSFRAVLGVEMLLYDGGRSRAQARQQEANIAIAESRFANLRDQIRFEVEQSYSQLQANFENIQTTALAVQQAEEALRLARLRFQAGVGTQTDVLRSQTELTRSRFNNLRAILSYNRALVALQRAVSNLPEGFLFDVP